MVINIVIDVMLGILAVLILIKYTITGFVRSMFGALKLIMSVVATYFLTPVFFTPTDTQSRMVAYLLVFSATYIILTAVAYLLDKLCHLPVLSAANRILGFALGAICAYISLCTACALLTVLLDLGAEKLFGQSTLEICDSTYIYRFFNDLGFFPLIGK